MKKVTLVYSQDEQILREVCIRMGQGCKNIRVKVGGLYGISRHQKGS